MKILEHVGVKPEERRGSSLKDDRVAVHGIVEILKRGKSGRVSLGVDREEFGVNMALILWDRAKLSLNFMLTSDSGVAL